MKRIIVCAVLLLSFINVFAQSGKSIYQKYSDLDQVSAVYVSPAMFRLIGKIPNIRVEGEDMDLAPVIRSLTGLYILEIENPELNDKLRKDVNKLLDSGNYELLMESKDDGEIVRMYTEGNENVVTSFLLLTIEGNESSFICIDGKIDRKDLEKVVASQM